MNRSLIPWLVNADGTPGYTWSPTSGCGPGLPCYERCWARAYHVRYRGGDFSVRLNPSQLDAPLRLRKPSTIGVCLMGDLLHDDVPTEFIVRVLQVMSAVRKHTFVVLTKRPLRLRVLLDRIATANVRCDTTTPWPLPNVWIGVSCEDRPSLARVDVLRDTPAAHRWISLEPQVEDVGALDLRGISLVVQGAESGPRRRPFDVQWARDVRDQCKASGVPYYLKQAPWGSHAANDHGDTWTRIEFGSSKVYETPTLDGHRCSASCLPWARKEGAP